MYTNRNMLCAHRITISKNMKFKQQRQHITQNQNIDAKDMGNSSIMSNMQLSKQKNEQTNKELIIKKQNVLCIALVKAMRKVL